MHSLQLLGRTARCKTKHICAATIVSFAFAITITPLFAGSSPESKPAHKASHGGVSVSRVDFHGWDAIILSNKTAQIVIVPAIGRVMQFGLTMADGTHGNSVSGPFWNNPGFSKDLKPDSEGWTNFGGDKVWPAPQADWPKIEGHGWPPPKAFDALPCTASIVGNRVQLVSSIDPAYGVRVRRVISLDSQRPVMTIETTYGKGQGSPIRMGVWTITQLASPERAFILLPEHSAFSQGYTSLLPAPPKDLQVEARLLSLNRDPENKTMIGNDGEALLWVGDGPDLLVKNKSPESSGEWPDQGSHAKIYTNSGEEMKYIEFELLSPLRDLKPGESSSTTSEYTLIRRTERDPLREAKKVLGQK
jgi:hypothetical protein